MIKITYQENGCIVSLFKLDQTAQMWNTGLWIEIKHMGDH